MLNTIQIPKPCHQNWDAMTTNEQGKHCLQCCKTVVDFTSRGPEEIVQYLKEHVGQSVCGRFTSTQINTPITATEDITVHIFNSSLSYFKKIAALILITFGIVVGNVNKGYSQTGKTTTIQTIGAPEAITPKPDSTINPMMVGKVVYRPRQAKKKPVKKANCHKPKKPSSPNYIQGDVSIAPAPATYGYCRSAGTIISTYTVLK